MARKMGPQQAEKTSYYTSGPKAGKELIPAGTPVPLYADDQTSLPADVRATDGSVIPGTPPTVLVSSLFEIPDFLFPDVPDPVVYTRILGGPVIALHPSVDALVDDLRARLVALEPGGGGEAATAADLEALDLEAVHKAGAETISGVKTFSSEPVFPAAKVPTSRTITAGTGLTGGGDLSANRTLAVAYGTTAGTAAQGNDSRITGAAADNTVVHTTGAETIAGTKTFAAAPSVPGVVTKTLQLIFDGDSITAGSQSRFGRTYPAQTVEGLDSRTVTTNVAVGGQTVAQMLSDVVAQVDPMYDPAKLNVVIVGGGTNDLYVAGGSVTVDTLYANYVAYHQGRRAAGFKTVALTLFPRTEVGTPGTHEAKRLDFNDRVRTNWATFADALADVGNDAVMGPTGASDNVTYFADKTHPTNAGYAVMARYVRAALASLGIPYAHDHPQYQQAAQQLWVPASRFFVYSGTATPNGALMRLPTYLFEADVDGLVTTSIEIPRDWTSIAVDLYWANAAGGAGDVRWHVFYNASIVAGATTVTTPSGFKVQTAGANGVVMVVADVITGIAVTTAALLSLTVQRFASSGADTLVNQAAFMGLMVRKLA